MSGILPDVGTVYTSLPAFKLDVFERGLQHSLYLITKSASRRNCYLTCGIRVGEEKKYCAFRVSASRVQGVTAVTTVHGIHSCQVEETEAKKSEMRTKMGRMVQKAKRELEESERKLEATPTQVYSTSSRSTKLVNYVDYVAGDEDRDDSYDESESESESDAVSTQSLKKAKTTSGSKNSIKTIFPSAKDVEKEIAALKLNTVQFPSPAQVFDTARQLLIVLHAYTQQHGYTVSRRYPMAQDPNGSPLVLQCYRNRARYEDADGNRCKFEIKAFKTDEGKWSSALIVGEHNHEVVELSSGDSTVARGAETATAKDEDNHIQASLPSYNPFSLPLSTSSNSYHSTSTPAYPQPFTTSYSAVPATVSTALKTTIPSASTLSTYPSDLVSFLRSFRSLPTDLPHLLNKLYLSGITSVETRLEILMMEPESLEKYIRMLNDQQVGMKVLEMVQEIRFANAGGSERSR